MYMHNNHCHRVTAQFQLINIIIINPLNAELNPIRHLLALVGARHIVNVSSLRVNVVTILVRRGKSCVNNT